MAKAQQAIAFKSTELKHLGAALAQCDIQAEQMQATQMERIFAAALSHAPLNATEMSREAKKAFKADIHDGYVSKRVGVSETSAEILVSYFFRALVYATNGICLDFKGKPQAYCVACESEPKAEKVWKKQVKAERTPKVGGATGKKASKPEVYTTQEIKQEILRFANMLGKDYAEAIAKAITAVESKIGKTAPRPVPRPQPAQRKAA